MSIRYGERLLEAGATATASVGSVADSYDDAMAEALNGSFKAERLHSALDHRPPEEFEAQHHRSQATSNAA